MAGVGGKDPYPYFEWFDPRESAFPPPTTGIFDEPNRQICVNVQWVKWLAGVISRLEYPDVYTGDDTTIETAIQEILKFQMALGGGENPCESDCAEPEPPRTIYRYRPVPLPDCVELVDADGDGIYETINITQTCEGDCMPIIIHNYECGCGDGASGTGGTSASGTTSDTGTTPALTDGQGSVPSVDRTTVCEFVTVAMPFFAQKLGEVVGDWRQLAEGGEEVTDAIAEAATDSVESSFGAIPVVGDQAGGAAGIVGTWLNTVWDLFTDSITNLPENLEELMNDTDFVLRLQVEAYGVLSNSDWSGSITRSQLKSIVGRMPINWGNALQDTWVPGLRYVLLGIAQFLPLEKINLQGTFARGDGDPELCAYLANQNGQTYEEPVDVGSVAPPDPNIVSYSNGSDQFTIRLFNLNTAYDRYTLVDPLPYDYTDVEIVGGGCIIDSVDVFGNSPNPHLRVNNAGLYAWGTIPVAGINAYDGYDSGYITPTQYDDIKALIEDRTGAFTPVETFTSGNTVSVGSDVILGCPDRDGGSATLVWVWTIERQAS